MRKPLRNSAGHRALFPTPSQMPSAGIAHRTSDAIGVDREENCPITRCFSGYRDGLYRRTIYGACTTLRCTSVDPSNPMDAAFEEFIQAQRDTLALYKTHENFDDPLAAAEAYRGVLYTIVGSIKSGALMSHEYPRAMRGVDWTSKAGLDNPDNNYFFALLDDEGSYRLYGKRGNTTQLIFQLVIGVPGWATQAPAPMSMCCMTRTSSSMKMAILRL